MRDGFLKVAAATPKLRVADCDFNTEKILEMTAHAAKQGVKLLVFPELGITGYTCEDLFLQEVLLDAARTGLSRVRQATKGLDIVVLVGLPFEKDGRLFNVAAIVQDGQILGLIPKQHIPNYAEFYEARYFAAGGTQTEYVKLEDALVPFGTKLLFACRELPDFVLGVEICEDIWVPAPPSNSLAQAGATVLANLSASDEVIGKADYRRALVTGQSARTISAYLYADAGEGESTTDLVFAGHNMIAENGTLLAEKALFEGGLLMTEIDLGRIRSERRRMMTFSSDSTGYERIAFSMPSLRAADGLPETMLTRPISKAPFVPADENVRAKRCKAIIQMQAMGLKKRLLHTGCKHAIIGISGGLDSTLALLVTRKAFELAGLDAKGIIAVTMPGFGTTGRTKGNAWKLSEELGATVLEVDIREAVRVHLRDLGHDESVHDVTYENAQARERTQLLMDFANQYNGMVIGTGDLSELALGFATYNGDHMSMYGVNASIPKTLVRYLVAYFADSTDNERLAGILRDILATPVSPELLPPEDGEISQKTEDIVGPYELHDFFLYYMLRFGFGPKKIYRMAVYAFGTDYDGATILKWMHSFYRRFFSQQFKRSCLPDGPKVGSVAVSPRGDWRMPSDACMTLWIREIEELDSGIV